jgi:hypothetical protein
MLTVNDVVDWAMKTRFTVNVDGLSRTVLSVWENPNSFDLNIHITGGGKSRKATTLEELVAEAEESDYSASEKHITIHNGTLSSENNMIKRTVDYGRESDTSVQVTSAIKTDNLYTPALFRICGDLSRDRYALPENCRDEIISLGSYSPATDQLRFMVVVSDVDKTFESNTDHPSNSYFVRFQKFRITLIWSYLNQPSHQHALDFFLSTTPEGGPISGFEWWEIYNFYTDLNMTYSNEYFDVYGEST